MMLIVIRSDVYCVLHWLLCCVVETDKAVESGMSPDYVANCILQAFCAQDSEVLIGPLLHRITVYLRNILPNAYFSVMARRAWQEAALYRKTS